MKPKDYLKLKSEVESAISLLEGQLADARELADKAVPENDLRPLRSEDVVVGQIVWGRHERGEHEPAEYYWHVIDQVRDPDDGWKAYVADDGCRYGLEGHWVEK